MAYNEKLADRVREALMHLPHVEEKKMFRGLAFLVNGKMCINVSGDELMCRYDPLFNIEVSQKRGVCPLVMKGKELKGYCYVNEDGYSRKKDFDYWVALCLAFNKEAKASKKKKKQNRR
jgi:TfoX/Sxy family transcriptional regulator of competence genes